MNTAERLEAINTPGKFELLVTSILRKDNKDYKAIVHTGINAQGDTIKSPVDGFCRVPGSIPPRYLLIAHTITKRDDLEKKWLHNHTTVKSIKKNRKNNPSESDDGDLLKACREAEVIRTKFTDAEFTVILVTNKHLPKGIELLNKVYEKAAELHVDVDIWEQSRLADFLDSTSEGHWLCKEYLDIDAEILSHSLLRSICDQSLVNYEKQFLTNPTSWIAREIDSQIENRKYLNVYTIQLLIGESGSGKSAAAYQLLKKHLESGGYGLWVSDELLKECTFLENALDQVLRNLYPSLLPDAGREALRLVQGDSRLLLIVDDVNRANDSTRLLQKLINWLKPRCSGTFDLQPLFSPSFVVCPVWPKISSSISPDFKETPWVDKVFVGSMNPAEGIAAVQATSLLAGLNITSTEATSLALKLGNDPILIGLFGSLLSTNTQANELASLTENVIERFITTTIGAFSRSGTFLEYEYRAALSTVATQMLKNRNLYPRWTEIKNWLQDSSDELAALRELSIHKNLCRLDQEEKFVFRHDRIQQTLLVESMIKLLKEPNFNSDILWEPFYTEIIAKAIVHYPQSQEFLSQLRNQLPLALVEAIRYFSTPITGYHRAIIEKVIEWANSSISTDLVPKSVFDAVCWSLCEIESPVLLEITESFPKYQLVLLARLRNGCTVSGINCCIYYNQIYFAPLTKDSWRDQALEQAKRHHKKKLLVELKQILKSNAITDEERAVTLTLAGFLGFTELEDEIATCWQLVIEKTQVLPIAIWASVQCCGAEPKKLLDPLIAYWAELPDEKDQYDSSLKNGFLDLLSSALAHGICDNVINYLISQCNVHESLRWYIARICGFIDKLNAIEFVVRSAVNFERTLAGTNTISTWMIDLTNNWNNSLTSRGKLSQASLERLKSLWENTVNDESLKYEAFCLWLTGCEFEQIDILRRILSDSALFREALWRRAQLGDHSTIIDLISILSNRSYWFYVAHHVWCDDIRLVAEGYLKSFKYDIPTDFSGGCFNTHNDLSILLSKIPVEDAERLLDHYWEHLGYSPSFIKTALYIGTPKCLQLGASSIYQCPTDVPLFNNLFEYLKGYFGFTFTISDRRDYWSVELLENLLPYLDRLSKSQIRQLTDVCLKLEIPEWSQTYLSHRLSEVDRRHYHPSDDDLLQQLDEFAAHENGELRVRSWLEKFDKREDQKNRILNIVDCWLAFNPTVIGLQIAAMCIRVVGTRKDVSILDQYTIEGLPNEITRIKDSTRFAVYRRYLD
ncbi:ATP-binding protein [Nostoc sp.]|uniref:ATP-binding protein n=1 Tax=Nostoc sp. TaxID=1180 RepID=UPI002FF58087